MKPAADEQQLLVELRGDLILVTRPGTSFSATYGKERLEPNVLLLAATMDRNADREAVYQFRADAFIVALQKARELGWVV